MANQPKYFRIRDIMFPELQRKYPDVKVLGLKEPGDNRTLHYFWMWKMPAG